MPIRILPPSVAAKIAAGEVIERPASVAKELLENSIDAGADDIRVDIAQGGRRLIRVSDNGAGIPAEEVELAFARHATSKLQTAEQLYHLQTLGFRGEALASVAAVSRLTLTTRVQEEAAGTLLRLEAGEIVHREALASPPGTVIQVENLFYSTPARLKFLRTDPTEAGHISRLVTSYAMAFPEKRFTLQHNQRLLLRTAGTGKLLDVLAAIYGLDIADQMIAVESAANEAGIDVNGYIGAPAVHRATRREMILFVNHRWIQDNSLSYAVREAYRTLIPQGRYPIAILQINMPPENVDVNIHPTKREVRFQQERQVFSVVQRAVRSALMAQYPIAALRSQSSHVPIWGNRRQQWLAPGANGDQRSLDMVERRATGASQAAPAFQRPAPFSSPTSAQPAGRLPMLRVIGQIAQTYIIAEGPGGMYLIDQHAAHERIRYEQLLAQKGNMGIASQELLQPMTVELTPAQAPALEEHLAVLAEHGFEIIPFGGTTFLIKRIPADLVGESIVAAVTEIIDSALDGGPTFDWNEQTRITLTCHTAIRAGQTLSVPEMQDLTRQLEQCALPHSCPHGRPTMIHLSKAQLEKEFGRT